MDEGLSNKIANLGIISAVLVVVIHAASFPATSTIDKWWNGIMVDGFCRMAVPYFFIVSGFLLARHCTERGWYVKSIQKRIKTLLVPFIVWNFLAFLLIYVLGANQDVTLSKVVADAFGVYPFSWPPHSPLWYVRSLMLYVVISPLIFWLSRRNLMSICILALGYLYVEVFPIGLSRNVRAFANQFLSVSGLFYFSWGAIIATHDIKLPRLGHKVVYALFCASLLMFVFSVLYVDGALHMVCFAARKFGALVALAGAWMIVPSVKWPDGIVKFAFPLYVLHIFPIIVWRYCYGTSLRGAPLTLMAICLAYIGHTIVYRLSPKLASALYGGRYEKC